MSAATSSVVNVMPRRKYTRELLQRAVEESTSVAGVLRWLGLPQAGGTHAHVSRTIKSFGLDTSHFIRHRNGSHMRRRTAAEILVVRPYGARREKPPLLRRALAEIGRPYACELCGIEGVWRGLPLGLEVDHLNGDFHDNRQENLRLPCPNCHAQTDNFAGRSRGKYARGEQLA